MAVRPFDFAIRNAFGDADTRTAVRRGPSRLEDEVTALYDQFRPAIVRYLISMRVPAGEADEVAQDVFLELFRHLREGKPRTNLRSWIFRVAHNLGLKRRIHQWRAPEQYVSETETDRRADSAPDPEELAAANQRQARLLAVVHALPERDRQCLSLRAEGLNYREIAESLGIALGSVAASLQRSLDRLGRADLTHSGAVVPGGAQGRGRG